MISTWLTPVSVWLGDFGVLATALLAAALLMRLLLADPASRVLLTWGTWTAVVSGAVLIMTPWWPRYGVPSLPALTTASAEHDPVVSDMSALPEPIVLIEPAVVSPASGIDAVARTIAWRQPATALWIVAAIATIGWIVVGFRQARRLLHTSKPAASWIKEELRQIAGNRHGVNVRTSVQLTSAVAISAIRPRIVLPLASAGEANMKAIRAALAHEWAHIRNGDLWLLALERLLVPLLALHPLFWWLRRTTRLDQELLADAAAAGDQPIEYAEALVAWAAAPASATVGLAALAIFERPSNLSRRVLMLLNRKRPLTTRSSRLIGLAAACLVLALSGGLAMFSNRPLTADEPSAQPAAPSSADQPPPELPTALEPATAPAEPGDADEPGETPAAINEDKAITLKLTLLALNRGEFAETKKQIVEIVEGVGEQKLKSAGESERRGTVPNHSVTARIAEIDGGKEADIVKQMQTVEGVKLVSRATIITLNGQAAQMQVSEQPAGRVIIEQEIDGRTVRQEQTQSIGYSVGVKPRVSEGESRLTLTIEAARVQPNVVQPRTVVPSTSLAVGNTLVIVSSEPYALLVTPTKVERQHALRSVQSRNPSYVPGVAAVPPPPARATATTPAPVAVPPARALPAAALPADALPAA